MANGTHASVGQNQTYRPIGSVPRRPPRHSNPVTSEQRAEEERLATTMAVVDLETPPVGRRGLSKRLLSYPIEADTHGQGHFVIFDIHSLTAGNITGKKQGTGQFQYKSYQMRGQSKRTETQIGLYMPPSVAVSYSTDYAEQEIGMMAGAAADVIGGAMRGELSLGGVVAQATNVENWKAAGAAGIIQAAKALDTVAPGASALAEISMGRIRSSKMELMFRGVGRRNFNYSFMFLPKSAKEAQIVDEIVFEFKRAAMPTYAPPFFGIAEGMYLNIPTTVDISYHYVNDNGSTSENNFLNKISTCFIKDVPVNYGGDRYTAYEENETQRKYHRDGGKNGTGTPPQRTSLSLTFNEIEIITQEAIDEGF